MDDPRHRLEGSPTWPVCEVARHIGQPVLPHSINASISASGEAGRPQHGPRVLAERRRMGAGTRRRPRHTERRVQGAEQSTAVAYLGESATVRKLGVFHCLAHGAIGRGRYAIGIKRLEAVGISELLRPSLELIHQLVPIGTAVRIVGKARVAQPVEAVRRRQALEGPFAGDPLTERLPLDQIEIVEYFAILPGGAPTGPPMQHEHPELCGLPAPADSGGRPPFWPRHPLA
jgi:hypothetical protein